MTEPVRTGRLRWDRLSLAWLLEEEWTNIEDDISWIPTDWWIRREDPLAVLRRWKVLVMIHDRSRFRTAKKFWRLKNAKAYAEVCYRMGVTPNGEK